MITGAHFIQYSTDAEADRAFVRDVLGFASVDAHGDSGWLIFKLPPAELAFHPADAPAGELYLMTDDLAATVEDLTRRGVRTEPVQDQGWGLLTTLTLPSGNPLGLYQPRHALATELP